MAYNGAQSQSEIARRMGVSRPTVRLCIDKGLSGGIDVALDDLPRSVRPAEKTVDDKLWVVSLACDKPTAYGYAGETWTMNQLARHVRMHAHAAGRPSLQKAVKATVQRILKEYKIRPHKIPYYIEKRDPDFQYKMAQVLVVYKDVQQFLEDFPNQDEDPGETIVSYDEKPGIQAIANVMADLAPAPGKHPSWSRDYEYKRLGTVSLFAGIDLYGGHVLGLVRERHRSSEFIEFLSELDHYYPNDWTIRMALDNHSTHVSKETMKWLKQRPGLFKFVFTPKHASWLNMVEILFSKMTRSFLRGIRVQSKRELVDRIYQYFREINESPVVFRRKYKLDEVLT